MIAFTLLVALIVVIATLARSGYGHHGYDRWGRDTYYYGCDSTVNQHDGAIDIAKNEYVERVLSAPPHACRA